MALIKTSMPHELFTEDLQPGRVADLTLSVPGQAPFRVRLVTYLAVTSFKEYKHRPSHNRALQIPLGEGRSEKRRRCTVWEWTGEGFDEGDLAAEYLSEFMGHKGA